MTDRSTPTARSISFVSCVGLGLFLAYQDGAHMLGLAKTALIATSLYVAYMALEAFRSRRKNSISNRG